MISLFAIAFCFLELSLAYLFQLPAQYWGLAWQAEAVLICMAAIYSNGGQRDRSIMTAIALWMAWHLGTDWAIDYFPYWLMQNEALVFSALVFWAIARPYVMPSQEIDPTKVCLAFYHGDRAPLLSSLSALLGLPFSSVGVLAGTTALRIGGDGTLTVTDARVYDRSPYHTIINTCFEANSETFKIIAEAVGSKVRVGPFRIGCIKALRPVLDHIGLRPKTIFHYIPSIFYYQAAGAAK